MGFWSGVLIGMFIGGSLGYVLCAIMVAGAEADKDQERFYQEQLKEENYDGSER